MIRKARSPAPARTGGRRGPARWSRRGRGTRRPVTTGPGPCGDDSAFAEQRRPAEVSSWGYRGLPGSATIMLRACECLVVRFIRDGELANSVDDADRGAALLNSLLAAPRGSPRDGTRGGKTAPPLRRHRRHSAVASCVPGRQPGGERTANPSPAGQSESADMRRCRTLRVEEHWVGVPMTTVASSSSRWATCGSSRWRVKISTVCGAWRSLVSTSR